MVTEQLKDKFREFAKFISTQNTLKFSATKESLSEEETLDLTERWFLTQNLMGPFKVVDWNTAPEQAEELVFTVHWADKDSNILKQTILVQENRP